MNQNSQNKSRNKCETNPEKNQNQIQKSVYKSRTRTKTRNLMIQAEKLKLFLKLQSFQPNLFKFQIFFPLYNVYKQTVYDNTKCMSLIKLIELGLIVAMIKLEVSRIIKNVGKLLRGCRLCNAFKSI